MVPIEVIIRSAHLALINKISDPDNCIYNVEALEEKRQKEEKWLSYQNRITRAYNKKVRRRSTLKVGDLVLKAAGHCKRV